VLRPQDLRIDAMKMISPKPQTDVVSDGEGEVQCRERLFSAFQGSETV
jgi:hypothetical protein